MDSEDVHRYTERVGASDPRSLLVARGLLVVEGNHPGVTQAGMLLLARTPPTQSNLRNIRHAGTTIETGTRSNVAEDVRPYGTIPDLIEHTRTFLADRLGTVERFGPDGRFRAIPVLPEFAWLEAIVNALTHRSYSIQGDGVRIRDFSDRLVVESPGRLPGLVRIENIQRLRYSRNPHIASVRGEMTGYVRELNEGVKRMFEEMASYGLKPPRFESELGRVQVTPYKQPDDLGAWDEDGFEIAIEAIRAKVGAERLQRLLTTLREQRTSRTSDLANLLGVSVPTVRKYMQQLESRGLVKPVLRSSTDPTRYWALTDHPFWTRGR